MLIHVETGDRNLLMYCVFLLGVSTLVNILEQRAEKFKNIDSLIDNTL